MLFCGKIRALFDKRGLYLEGLVHMLKEFLFLALLGIVGIGMARQSRAAKQSYHCNVGKFKVVALFDGYVDLHLQNIVKGDSQFEHPYLQATSPNDVIQIPINVYLVDMGSRVVLVDVGLAGYEGSQSGLLLQALQKAGYEPDQITDILITHLDPDHVAGLLTKDGQKAFKNAWLYVSKQDLAYWVYEQQLYPQLSQLMAKLIVPYKLQTFLPNQKLFDGVSVYSMPGHTPGHSGFLFESDGQKLLFWGDVVHIHELQFSHPGISLTDDSDSAQAIETRKNLFEKASSESILVAGAHIPYPGIGWVRKTEELEGFVFEPVSNKK